MADWSYRLPPHPVGVTDPEVEMTRGPTTARAQRTFATGVVAEGPRGGRIVRHLVLASFCWRLI